MAHLRHLLCALLLSASPLHAKEVMFYRCTDATGALALQNMPCPKGSKQEIKPMQAVTTVPMNATPAPAKPAAAAVAPAAAEPAPRREDGAETAAEVKPDRERLPPPNLFQCTTHDQDGYVTEDGEPQSRCVALRTIGLDGNPNTGAGQACEVVRDTCARVPDGALCGAWRKRLGETEVAWRFARLENVEKNKAEFERVQRIVDQSACGD
jgi:hypothetical protein